MTTAWTKALIACFTVAVPFACVISTDGDPIGNGGDGGDGGSSTAQGGSAGSGGNAGTSMSGSGGGGGQAGTEMFPTPVCTAEPDDDECITCLKQQCCDEWRACDDFDCDIEWRGITACVSDEFTAEAFADEMTLEICIEENVDDTGLPLPNTNDLISCINEVADADGGIGTRCGVPCFGTDIFLD